MQRRDLETEFDPAYGLANSTRWRILLCAEELGVTAAAVGT